MAKTRLRDRIIMGTGAALFLVTTIGFTAMAIWDGTRNGSSSTTGISSQNDTPKEGQLAGTQLAGFTPVEKTETLQSTDAKVGEGKEATSGNTVIVDYTGAVATTGKIFQSSKDTGQPATLSLDQVIEGWKEGIPGMKVGGERRLIIPAAKAYGANPPQGSGIPANADLVFDIVLHDVQ